MAVVGSPRVVLRSHNHAVKPSLGVAVPRGPNESCGRGGDETGPEGEDDSKNRPDSGAQVCLRAAPRLRKVVRQLKMDGISRHQQVGGRSIS